MTVYEWQLLTVADVVLHHLCWMCSEVKQREIERNDKCVAMPLAFRILDIQKKKNQIALESKNKIKKANKFKQANAIRISK